MATLKCEVTAAYVSGLKGCFGEFAGLNAEVGSKFGEVQCVALDEDE